MTGYVVEPDSILVEVVEYCHTELVSLPIVRLWLTQASCVRPGHSVISPSRRPVNLPSSNFASSPEIFLSFSSNQIEELILLGLTVDGNGFHSICPTEFFATTVGEGRAAQFPRHQEVLTTEAIVGTISTTTSSSTPSITTTPTTTTTTITIPTTTTTSILTTLATLTATTTAKLIIKLW